jgi:hypothetical protein
MTLITVDTAEIGKLGGEARARNLSPEARSDAAKIAAQARWAGHVPKKLVTGQKKKVGRPKKKAGKGKKAK